MKPKEARDLGPFDAAREALKGFVFGTAGWSDRAAALSAAATAEAFLQIVLMCYFARDDGVADRILARSLSGLKSRVDLAYCLGLIDADLARDLRSLASIRNAFAHNITILLFDDERVLSHLRNLGASAPKSDYQALHAGFIKSAEEILTRLYHVAQFIWWEAGSLPVLEPPSEEEWRTALETELSVLDELDADSLNNLAQFGIVNVEDVLSAKNSFLIEAFGPKAHDLIVRVHLWVVSELYPADS